MIAPGIRLALLADATVATAVSQRIYFQRLPQEPTYPAIVVELVSSNSNNAVNELPILMWSRVRIISWGKSYQQANELAETIERALNGRTFSVAGQEIRSITADTLRDLYEPAVEAYYTSQDFRIWHTH